MSDSLVPKATVADSLVPKATVADSSKPASGGTGAPPRERHGQRVDEPQLHSLDGFDQWSRHVSNRHKTAPLPDSTLPAARKDREQRRVDVVKLRRDEKAALCAAARGALTVFWLGRGDPESPLALLSGSDDVVRAICEEVMVWLKTSIDRDGIFVSHLGNVAFPKPTGLYCNMMPIIMPNLRESLWNDDAHGWKASVPKEYHGYLPLIMSCPLTDEDEFAVGYLTVDERAVPEGAAASHRRGGLHAESPGLLQLPPGGGGAFARPPHPSALTFFWGGGHYTCDGEHGVYSGGVYMASNVGGSCRVWNASVHEPRAMGRLGDLEHMRPLLGRGTTLGANALVWMTDTTPHESLPLPGGTPRQYFRLVTSKVTAWYADHSTPNPTGVVPPDDVLIVHGDKFAAAAGAEAAPTAAASSSSADASSSAAASAADADAAAAVPVEGLFARLDVTTSLSEMRGLIR